MSACVSMSAYVSMVVCEGCLVRKRLCLPQSHIPFLVEARHFDSRTRVDLSTLSPVVIWCVVPKDLHPLLVLCQCPSITHSDCDLRSVVGTLASLFVTSVSLVCGLKYWKYAS